MARSRSETRADGLPYAEKEAEEETQAQETEEEVLEAMITLVAALIPALIAMIADRVRVERTMERMRIQIEFLQRELNKESCDE